MSSPVMAIIAGVLTFALGGLFLVAQPFGLREVAVPMTETPSPTGVTVTVNQECVDLDPCRWTASDPRLPGTLAHEWTGGVDVESAKALGAGFTWMDVTSEGPEGGWTGHVYALWGRPTQNFLVLSGVGANEGWHYVASSIDPEPDGDFEWIGTLYEGELPPYGPLAAPSGD